MPELPAGTVTFLFTDVEGSTRLLHELGAEGYAEALAEHRRILREAFGTHGGVEVDTQGDAFFVAFPTAPGALSAAATALDGLASGPISVRMGVHTGTPLLTDEGYVGADVHRAARIAACGNGGQVLVSSSTAALLEGAALRDLGEHRLKDLSAPERIYQLGPQEFPALKSLYRTNLPVPATSFLGRERELGEALVLLSRDDVRLLTMTGPGGTGKTRLAMQTAGALAERYPDGVWWIPLAPLRDPGLVLEAAAQAVGAKAGLAEHIADKSMLLLFDNFEQVVEAADGLSDLLAACPNLDLLVTSREPLHLTGEQEYPVPPLVHEEGVGFFLARARAVKPDFAADDAVSEICRRLDDLPLALELAAARVKALSSAQILERLEQRLALLTGGARDLPERQRTLRAAIEWSHDLLTPGEQRLFGRLAVFSEGCTLDAAEGVCEADLDTLQSLVDKSLLRQTDERFWMLGTIREYAAERLQESGEAEELGRRHADHFLALAEEAEPSLLSANSGDWPDRLEQDHDNLRAALDWLQASADGERTQRLAGAVHEFFCARDHVPEGGRYLEAALGLDVRPTAARATALTGAAHMAHHTGDLRTARPRAEAALALYGQLGDAWGAAHASLWLGQVIAAEGEFARAQQLFAESARMFSDVDDDYHSIFSRRLLAWMYNEVGDRKRARALHEANLDLARARGYRDLEAATLGGLASYAIDEGRSEDALSLATASLRAFRDVGGSRVAVANQLCRCAGAQALAGRAVTAALLLSCAEARFSDAGEAVQPYLAEENAETLAGIHAQLDEVAFAEAWARGQTLPLDEAVALALDEFDRDERGCGPEQ